MSLPSAAPRNNTNYHLKIIAYAPQLYCQTERCSTALPASDTLKKCHENVFIKFSKPDTDDKKKRHQVEINKALSRHTNTEPVEIPQD